MGRFEIRCQEVLLGSTELEWADTCMGVQQGRFIPAAGYTKFHSLFAQDPQTRETLDLPLAVFHANVRIPTSRVHIFDYSAELGEADGMEVAAHFPDYGACRELFEKPC